MGALPSTATRGDGADAMDDAWAERAYVDGVPFTLLHDDAFVAEKFQELQRTRGVDAALDDASDALEITGTDELPMDELERMADAARIKLFAAQQRHGRDAMGGENTEGDDHPRKMLTALSAMEGTALARPSRAWVAIERRRTKQSEIVRDYFARLAERMNSRATERERMAKRSQASTPSSHNDASAASETNLFRAAPPRPGAVSCAGLLGMSLFNVASFRLQLEMLKAFRTTGASLFENGVLSLVHTVLEFPPFVLHQEENDATVTTVLVDDVYRFCGELLRASDLSVAHRDVLLVLLLAVGICSGRATLLIEFVTVFVGIRAADLANSVGVRSLGEWIEGLLVRLESYRVEYELGPLTDDSLLKQISIKTIKDDASSIDDEGSESSTQPTAIATDGSYVYTWNLTDGLIKIGTGANFTVAGRVYAQAPAQQYLQTFHQPRTFQCGFYGTGLDATSVLQKFATTPSRQFFEDTILPALRAEDEEASRTTPPRLFVQLEREGERRSFEFDDRDKLCEALTEPGFLGRPEDILFAFYGDFVVVGKNALAQLQEAAALEDPKDGSTGVVLDAALLEKLMLVAPTTGDDNGESSEKELILLYSTSQTSKQLYLEKFAMGDAVSSVERLGDKIYFSSMVFCGGRLYLSLLHPVASNGPQTVEGKRHEPRTLLQISPTDLSVSGSVTLSAGDSDMASGLSTEARVSQPLFTYVTEGRRLYEIEISAERFRVRVFGGLVGSTAIKKAVLVRSFDVDVKQIQCTTYVNCLLKILKRELCVGEADAVLPTFFTNGSYMWMVLPSIAPVRASQSSGSGSRFDCLMFDCGNGQFVSEGSTRAAMKGKDKQILKSFERSLPSSSCCFDATNNSIWIANVARSSLSMFKNSGRRIVALDEEEESLPANALEGGHARTEFMVLRVLSFLAQHAGDGTTEATTVKCPFSAETDANSLAHIVDVAERFVAIRDGGSAASATIESECLRCCLSVLRRSCGHAVSGATLPALASFQARLPKLLASILDRDQQVDDASIVREDAAHRHWNMRVVSMALALSAQTAHLVDANLSAQLDRVEKLIQKWRKQNLSPSECVVTASLLRQLRKTIERTAEADAPPDIFDRFATLWTELVEAQEMMLDENDAIDSEACSAVHQELIALVNFFLQLTFIRAFVSTETFQLSLEVFQLVCQGIARASTQSARKIRADKIPLATMNKKMRVGLVRQVAPTSLASASLLLRNWAETVKAFSSADDASPSSETPKLDIKVCQEKLGMWLRSESGVLRELYASLGDLGIALEADSQTKSVSTVSRTTRSEVMESSHEYENSLDVTQELRIPGATQITITFDARSRTERSYDYVTFFKDRSQTSYYGEQQYSGRDGEFNWPGVTGLPPLVIDSDHCFVSFHTDSSNTDWGYKFTAVGELFEKVTIVQRHWMTSLTEMAVGLIDEAARLLVESAQLVPISATEALNDRVLHSELLQNGVAAEREQDAGVVQLLREFTFPPEGSDAEKVLRAMERESGSARLRARSKSGFGGESAVTSVTPINTAIRAVAAAIIHHNMWGMDAFALAQNLRSDVSEQLQRGWKNAQKMRDWFHLGDAADAGMQNGFEPPSRQSARDLLRRQPSAYKGMSDDALNVLSKNVVERANFLLEMTPMSFSHVSGAKRRWGFLAKYGSALSVATSPLSKTPSNSTLGKWYSLLDELQDATDLRRLLNYRRSSSERRSSRRVKSVTEQVLEFIQSDIDITELRTLITVRNVRAEYRACGLWLYHNVSAAGQSVQWKMALAESCAMSLRKVALDAATVLASLEDSTVDVASLPLGRLHFGTFLSGCDGVTRNDVNNAFGACLNQYVHEMAQQETFNTEYAVALLKAMCIDYDADDTYLLQESNVLPQLLRLLASKASRVRRSAQVLLDVFLSRLGDSGDRSTEQDDSSSASHFQKQLFATVGLQLEGIASQLRALSGVMDLPINGVRDREHNLGGPLSTLTVPVSKNCDVRWNHSIMLWLYVSSTVSSYALKIGDEVRHGPSWPEDNAEGGSVVEEKEGSAELTGVVTAIPSPTSVRVKWSGQSVEKEYEFDPKAGKLEVVLVGEGIGGVVFCKGTKNLVKDGTVAAPWSHFGLFLNDRRQLSYRIACGPDKECVYETNYELDGNEWAHVAVIHNEEVLKFYINGLMVIQHILDPMLVLEKNASAAQSMMIESVHPITEDSVDKYWPVHIPGASKIRIVFDPLSELDESSGFVRFYQSARCTDVWGENKYTGRYHDPQRNFPGALSNRHRRRRSFDGAMASPSALEIPSDRFLVHFHHSGDSSSWGFRLLATPEFVSGRASDEAWQSPSLNAHPFYIGEPPARILDMPAARCWVYQPEIASRSLDEDEVVASMQASCPTSAPAEIPLERALHVIGLLQTCCETSRGRELIATPENVGDLMLLAFEEIAPVEVRCASIVVLKHLCGSVSAEFMTDQFKRVHPAVADSGDFVDFVFNALSTAVSVWSRCHDDQQDYNNEESEATPSCPMDLQLSSTEGLALVTAYASLLRRLAQNSEWVERVCQSFEAALSEWKALQAGNESSNWNSAAANITAALVVLGSGYNGISVGGRVRCRANIDTKETIETGCLLRFQQKRGGERTARILFDCDPTNPVNVPTTDVAYLEDEETQELTTFLETVAPYLFAGTLQRLYNQLLTQLTADLPPESTFFKPKVSRKENVEVLESEHPYTSGEDITYPLRVHGVQEIVIYFDEQSCTASQNDYVSFVKRNDDKRSAVHAEARNGKPYWGEERYYGDSFPGVRGVPPLRIPASSVDVHFHTESSAMGTGVLSTEWGFKLTAHAFEEATTYAPEMPPSFRLNAINDVRARALKSLYTCLRLLKPTAVHPIMSSAMKPLVSSVVRLANTSDDGRPTQWPSRSQMFESKHPYSNSVRECITVTFHGAARLIVTFDAQSRTEQGSDKVTFFKAQSQSDRWGAEYSGCDDDDAVNWPGVGDRAPLIIPSDSFTLLWVTDASNVDWGWRFTVVVEYPILSPLMLRMDELDKQAHNMWEIFYEGIGPQRRPFVEEYNGFDKFGSVVEWHASQVERDASGFLLHGPLLNSGRLGKQRQARNPKFRVIDSAGIEIFAEPSESGTALGRLKAGDELYAVSECREWIKMEPPVGVTDEAIVSRWIKRRTGDKTHVVAISTLLQNENVLVVGVDDDPATFAKPNDHLHLDDTNAERHVVTSFVSPFNVEALKGQSSRYQSLAYDTHRALSIKYARETLCLLMGGTVESSEAMKSPVQLRDFGSPNDLLLLLSHLFHDHEGQLDEAALEQGMRSLLTSKQDEADACALIDRCLDVLETSVNSLPSGRGAMRVLESRHPYPDDAELYWQMSIPGAKKIVVYFDPQTKTEESCDWVCLYKNGTDRGEFYGESIYHGRNGVENWPGFGGRPPLVIDADNCEVYFHSDANQNDWGFKFYAVGVFDELDSSDAKAGSPPLDEAKVQALVKLMKLSLWLLGVTARACSASPSALKTRVASSVFSPRMVDVLLDGIQDHPQQVRSLGIQLLQQLAHNVAFIHSLPTGMVETLYARLVTKIRAQFAAEDRSETKSEYLQMLVECVMFVDMAIDSAGYSSQGQAEKSDAPSTLEFSSISDRDSDSKLFEWSTPPMPASGALLHLQFVLRSVSDVVTIKLVADRSARGVIDSDVCFVWESSGTLTTSPLCGLLNGKAVPPPALLQSGDAVSIVLDLDRHVLVLRKNALCVMSSARLDLNKILVDEAAMLRVVVTTTSEHDAIEMQRLSSSPLASLPLAIAPNWYQRVCDAMSLLLDVEDHRVATVVECESEHPLPKDLGDCSEQARERVCIQGAYALEIRFDRRTVLDEHHRLRFLASPETKDACETEIVGIRGTFCDDKYPALFLNDPVKRTCILKPEDRVVRSSDWCYADEDGGPGSIGVVEAIVAWGGRSGCGVRVRWTQSREQDSCVGIYRYGHDGFFDVQLLCQPKEWDMPLVIPGDTLEYILDHVQDHRTSDDAFQLVDLGEAFQGTLHIDSTALSLDVRKTKLVLGDESTIEFWICVQDQAFKNASSSASAVVFSLVEITTLDSTQGLCVGATSQGRFMIVARTDEGVEEIQSSDQDSPASLVLQGQWVHVGVVFASSKVAVYANGERACEVPLNRKLLGRQTYVTALKFGGSIEASPASSTTPTTVLLPLSSHICDVRIWDAALRSEQVHGHASGMDDSTSARDSVGWQSPPAPRNQSRSSFVSEQLLTPPSPSRSIGSPSRAMNVPSHQRKWITTNRTGRDLVTVRADCPVPIQSNDGDKPVMIYYEAHVLSGGRLCVGFAGVDAQPSSRQQLLGEFKNAVGLELPRKLVHIGSEEVLEPDGESDVSLGGLRSPRRRSSSSGGGSFSGDVFSREGDVIGCAYVPSTKNFNFYLNGDLLVQVPLESDAMAAQDNLLTEEEAAAPSPRTVQREFDSLVDEMLTMGFAREASEDALEATSSGGVTRAVPRAVDWLLEEGTAISSPRRLSSSSPFTSPRRRLSSTSSETFSSRRAIRLATASSERGHFVPAATLGAQGGQGIAWNFGHRAFKYAPVFDGVVITAMAARHHDRAGGDGDQDDIGFEIFDHAEEKWERVVHRHRVQEMVPLLLAHWKLDEGTGATVYDCSGRDQVGTIQTTQPVSSSASTNGPTPPRSRKPVRISCWDPSCLPPVARTRGTDSQSPGTESSGTAGDGPATVWGYHFYVIPHFSANSIGRRRFQTQAHRFIMDGPPAELRHDHQLIKYVNKVAVAKQLTLSQILRASWSELAPSDDDLVKWPVLVEIATGVSPSTDDASTVTTIASTIKTKALNRLGKRFKLLQEINGAVSRLLPFVAFSKAPSSSAGAGVGVIRLDKLICDQRYRVFHAVKRGLWDEALKRTTETGEKHDLVVNRPRAMRHRVSGKVDTEGRFALFSQAFRQLGLLDGAKFRRANAVYKVEFLGENAQDAGGPYRETLTQYADELHSSQLPLLIASSNAQHNVGTAREKWVLNPSATSAIQLEMLEFLGKLMGATMRSQEFIPLRLALLIWKRLAGERVTSDDLAQVDSMIVSSMAKIRTIDSYGVTRDMFEDIVMESFTTLSTDNRVVPLKPHGASIAVTFDSRVEFADLVESYRLHEFDRQIAALLRGLAMVVPPRLLALFTGTELEQLVCGSPEVDVDLLQKCSEYSSCSADDAHIQWFWQVLRDFSHEERSAFLRFVWGRSRLPASEKDFTQRFKLQSFSKTIPAGSSADAYLPIAHTCFFSVEMPRYSSVEVVREKLTYAMYNCQEIDGDGDSVAANQLGWEE